MSLYAVPRDISEMDVNNQVKEFFGLRKIYRNDF